MQSVGADHQSKAPLAGMFESDLDVVRVLPQLDDLVAETRLRLVLDPLEHQSRKVAAPQRNVAAAGQFAKDTGAEARDTLSRGVDDAQLAHVIADALDAVRQPHLLGDVVASPPKVDDIAAVAQCRRAIDQHRLVLAAFSQKASVGPAMPIPEISTDFFSIANEGKSRRSWPPSRRRAPW